LRLCLPLPKRLRALLCRSGYAKAMQAGAKFYQSHALQNLLRFLRIIVFLIVLFGETQLLWMQFKTFITTKF